MARLVVHVGTHKTGSTALQEFLRQHRASLAARGLVFVDTPEVFIRFMRTAREDLGLVDAARRALDVALERARLDGRRAVLSFEGLSGDPFGGYANTVVVARMLAQVVRAHDAQVVVYLRRQDLFTESIYTQHVQEGGADSFDAFVARLPSDAFDWLRFVRHLDEAFGAAHVTVRRYDRAVLPKRESLVVDFFSAVGTSLEGIPLDDVAVANTGYGRDALEIARLMNPQLSVDEKKTLRAILQSGGARTRGATFDFFDERARFAFLARYDDSNARLARERFDDVSGALFSPPSREASAPYPGLTVEAAIPLVVRGAIAMAARDSTFVRMARRIEERVGRAWRARRART